MSKQKKEQSSTEQNQIELKQGNIDVLSVKILSEINVSLKRIANALDK